MSNKNINLSRFIIAREFKKSVPYFKCNYCRSIQKISNLSYFQIKYNTCSQFCKNFSNYTEYQNYINSL